MFRHEHLYDEAGWRKILSDAGFEVEAVEPVLSSATPYQVTGTACADAIVPKPCTVEVFLADRGAGGYGQGRTFLGAATTNSDGTFAVAISGANVGDYVTSTATDATGNTSEFGANVVVTSGPPVPTPTAIQGRQRGSSCERSACLR